MVCAPALLAKEQEKANTGLSNWKLGIRGQVDGSGTWWGGQGFSKRS